MTNPKHGHRPCLGMTPTYRTWHAMRQRVRDKPGYVGMYLDPSWGEFATFLEEMGERPEGKTLDRIDNNQGYFKDNCRWATAKEQANNRSVNRCIEFDGETLTVSQWDTKMGYAKGTVSQRLRSGWSLAKAITQKTRHYDLRRRHKKPC